MKIQEFREALGLKQSDFAAQMGVCQATVSGWENEIYLPKARDLPRLAKVLRCSISDLFAEPTELEPDSELAPCYYDDTASEE